MIRILVTGSRDWADERAIKTAIGEFLTSECGILPPVDGLAGVVIVHGDCPTGADRIADQMAEEFHDRWGAEWPERHPANWRSYGKRAGFTRNEEMVDLGATICFAFIGPCTSEKCRLREPHGSHGASHCASYAEGAGIPVRRFETWSQEAPDE